MRRLLVIGHRGASGHRPEHTLAAYALAAQVGADFLEPDLVSTSDGVLVARHENRIDDTTDVADHPEFTARRTTQEIDGVELTGWFTEDFTLAELKTLRARERLPELRRRITAYDGQYAIPSLDEIVALRERISQEVGRPIGLYPETKHPAHFRALGLALEEPLARCLHDAGLDGEGAPMFLQSFARDSLERLRALGIRAPLVQLLDAPADLAEVRGYAEALGVAKELVIPRAAEDTLGEPTELAGEAHDAGLLVHAWTFRAENTFLPRELRSSQDPAELGDLAGELAAFLAAGVDGVFCDQPEVASAVLDVPA